MRLFSEVVLSYQAVFVSKRGLETGASLAISFLYKICCKTLNYSLLKKEQKVILAKV